MTILSSLKGSKIEEGLYVVGEFRGMEEKPSGDKIYRKIKVLNGDNVMKLDLKPEEYGALKELQKGARVMLRYYTFQGKYGVNHNVLEAVVL